MEVAELFSSAMASEVHIVLVGASRGSITSSITDYGKARLSQLEARWSRFEPYSEVSILNRAGGQQVRVSADTMRLVDSMIRGWRLTGGAFDPTVLPSLVESGYAASTEDWTKITELPDPAGLGEMGSVEVDHSKGTVRLPYGLVIDPGGIGKGLAADLVASELVARGADGAMVSIGGDLSMVGRPPHQEGWVVSVEDAFAPGTDLTHLKVSGGGVATSSRLSRQWMEGAQLRHHLIDPTTRAQSATSLAALTAVAPCAWLAEVHSTAAILRGPAGFRSYGSDHGVTLLATSEIGELLTELSQVRPDRTERVPA